MDNLLLGVVVVSGLCAVSSAARQFSVVYEAKGFLDAQTYCRTHHTDLATIRDMEEQNTLNSMMDSNRMADFDYQAWIGLQIDVGSWGWSLSDGGTEFRRWDVGRPQDGGGDCATMSRNGEWANKDCEVINMPVCFDVTGPQTFVLINTPMAWGYATSYCRVHHTALAMVRNMEENQMVQNLVETLIPPGDVWIGLYRDGWKWSDGSDSSFTSWKTNEPLGVDGDCGVADFSANGRWATTTCNAILPFICYDEFEPVEPVIVEPVAMRVMKVRLQKSSSLDLNDPVVMEGLLKQLKLKLKAQGLNDDIKLSWKKQADGKVFHKEEKKTSKKRRDEL